MHFTQIWHKIKFNKVIHYLKFHAQPEWRNPQILVRSDHNTALSIHEASSNDPILFYSSLTLGNFLKVTDKSDTGHVVNAYHTCKGLYLHPNDTLQHTC